MSDLARTHWVGDGCVPPHSTEPAVLPPISDSTVTPVASEGTMRLRRERDEARAEVARLHNEVWRREAAIQRMRDLPRHAAWLPDGLPFTAIRADELDAALDGESDG